MLISALEALPSCSVQVWRLGGAGVAVQTDTGLLLIDPFIAPQGAPGWIRREPAVLESLPITDLVLVTHEHDDHADPVAFRNLSEQPNAIIAAPQPSIDVALNAGVKATQTRVLAEGDALEYAGFHITALPVVDHDAIAPLAYLVRIQAGNRIWSLYHGRDAHYSDLFARTGEQYPIDCACLSVAGVYEGKQYYLTPAQSIEAAQALGAKTLIPLHWDLWTVNGLLPTTWNLITPENLQIVPLTAGESWRANDNG